MKIWTKRQYLTYMLLFALLLVDFSRSLLNLIVRDLLDPSVVQIYFNQLKILSNLLFMFQWQGSVPILIFILGLNRDRLQEMNIDRFYVFMLITAGLLPLYKSPHIFPYNFFGVIALIYAVYILFSKKVKFGVVDSNALKMILLITGVFAGIIICIAGFSEAIKINPSNSGQLLDRFLFQIIPGSIYEEAMYRGVLYMLLMDVGVSRSKAFYIQAFWYSGKHISFLLVSPFFYWIILPITGLTYGYIAMRSKSLTLTAFAHLLYNILVLFVYS